MFVIGSDATFTLSVDGGADKAIVLAATRTSTNYLMSHLVTDMFAAIDSVVSGTLVANVANRLYLETDTTGTSGSIVISGVDAITTAQLGWANATDYGESAVSSNPATHLVSSDVQIIKLEQPARIVSASGGQAEYEWRTGDTSRVGMFNMTFEFKSDQGRFFQIPTSFSDYTIEIIADPNDRIIQEGE